MMQDVPDGSNFGAKCINLSQIEFTSELVCCIPAKMARELRAIPVYQNENRTGIAVADPSNLNTTDTLVHFLNREIELLVADKYQIDAFLERLYGENEQR